MKTIKVPKNFPVKPLKRGQLARDRVTCGTCGLSWDDAVITAMTPTPSARCPFEQFHVYEEVKRPTNEVSYTPGPWKVLELGSVSLSGKQSIGYAVDTSDGARVAICGTGDEAKRKAELIASAPELLEALETNWYQAIRLQTILEAIQRGTFDTAKEVIDGLIVDAKRAIEDGKHAMNKAGGR